MHRSRRRSLLVLLQSCEAADAFNDIQNWFVGTDQELSESIMTKEALYQNMEHAYALASNNLGDDADWRNPEKLETMHMARNRMFGLKQDAPFRGQFCGKPNQALLQGGLR